MINKQIEKAAQEYAKSKYPPPYFTPEAKLTFEAAIAAAYTHGVNFAFASQWVSVEERLPQGIDPVLVYVADVCIAPELSYTIAYFEKGAWHFLDSYYYDCKISHWLPIPPLNPEKE